jgi:hypothetical protein
MRRAGFVGVSALMYMCLVGMGNVGTPLSVEVPEPATNYAATVVDQSDMATRLEKFSFGGQTFISGKMGDANISIKFDKVGSIGFTMKDGSLTAEVRLKDGALVPVVVRKGTVCYGKFTYGDFRIALEDISSITIHGEVSAEKEP